MIIMMKTKMTEELQDQVHIITHNKAQHSRSSQSQKGYNFSVQQLRDSMKEWYLRINYLQILDQVHIKFLLMLRLRKWETQMLHFWVQILDLWVKNSKLLLYYQVQEHIKLRLLVN